ncbi:MAG: hypothetical protein R6U95_03615 [Bacteroidales bacterium]
MFEKKYVYRYDKETSIIYNYYGMITIQDSRELWIYGCENYVISLQTKGFILDYGEADFDVSVSEYIEIPEFYKKNCTCLMERK